MPIEVTSRGLTFTFKDGTSRQQIEKTLAEHFSGKAMPVKKKEVGLGTALKRGLTEDAPYGLATAADFLAGGLANVFGDTESVDKIYSGMDKRTAARDALLAQRQQEEQQSLPSKVVQGVAGGLPQMLTGHATQAARNMQKGADASQARKALGVDTVASLAGIASGLLGKGRLGTAAAGAVGGPVVSYPQNEMNKAILEGTDAAKEYEREASDYLVDAIVGGAMGAAFPNKKGQAKTKTDPDLEAKLREREAEYAARNSIVEPQSVPRNKDLEPSNIDADGPYGMQYEMKLPGAKVNKKGKKAYEERQAAKGQPEESEVDTVQPEPNPDQLDMFVEDNRKVVERNLQAIEDERFQKFLQSGASDEARKSAALLEQEQAPWRAQDEQLAAYQELFPVAENRALPKQEVSPEFEQQSLFGNSWNPRNMEIPDISPERGQIVTGLYRNAADGKPLTEFGEAGVKLIDTEGNPISSRGMGIDPEVGQPEPYPEFWKNVESNKAWEQFKAQQAQETVDSWRKGIIEQAEINKMEDQYLGLQDYLNKEPSVNYGVGKKTRDFLEREAMQKAIQRKQQGGFINPAVFAEGIMKGVSLLAKGVRAFPAFVKKLKEMFGNSVKGMEKDIHNAASRLHKLSPIGIYSTPIHDLATKLKYTHKDGRMWDALNRIDSAVASVKESFRTQFYDEQLDKGIKGYLGSGAKFGANSSIYNFLSNPATNSMLEKTKHLWNRPEPATLQELSHLTPEEKMAFFDMRKTLDDAARLDGIDPSKNPNYMPRMRLGDFVVVARNPDGSMHVESTDSAFGVTGLKRKLKEEGKTIIHEASGLKADVYTNKHGAKYLGEPMVNSVLGDVFDAHRKIAENISGYSGQRDVRQMKDAISMYISQLEKSRIRKQLEEMLPDIEKAIPDSDQYERILRYMRTEAGLGFMYEAKFVDDTLKAAMRTLPPAAKIPGMARGLGQVFNSLYIMASGINLIQAVMSPVFALQHLNRLGVAGEVSMMKAMKHMGSTTMRSLLRMSTPLDDAVVNRAISAGFLENPADVVGIERQTNKKFALDFLKDISRSSRLEFGVRADTFVSMYNYYIKEVGLSDKEAFDAAGQFVRKSFVGIREADRAPWVQSTGRMAPLMASLSTFPIGMAGKLYAAMGMTKPQVAASATIFATALMAGGIRGMPGSDLGGLLVAAMNLFGEEEEAVKTFDDLMVEYAKKNPKMSVAINGVISEYFGLDMSRSLGWPGLTMLLPYGHVAMEALTGNSPAKGIVPAVVLGRAGAAGMDLLQNAMGTKAMSPGDMEAATQKILPRGISRVMDNPEVYDTKGGDLLGRVSPEANGMSRATGVVSMEERQLRSIEGTKSERQRQLTQLAKDTTKELVKTILYEDRPEAKKQQIEEVQKQFSKLIKNGIPLSADTIQNAIVQELMDVNLTREQREIVAGQLTGILLRNNMEGEQEEE